MYIYIEEFLYFFTICVFIFVFIMNRKIHNDIHLRIGVE